MRERNYLSHRIDKMEKAMAEEITERDD